MQLCKFRFVIEYAHSVLNIRFCALFENKCTNDVTAIGYWVAKKPEPGAYRLWFRTDFQLGYELRTLSGLELIMGSNRWVSSQTFIHRLETALGWASADPFAFVMLMSASRCTARHSGACRCAPIDFAYPRGSRFQPKQGSDSSRRARDTAATMLHFTHFWRHRGESAMEHCQLYNCMYKKCVYMNISDKNWPNNVEFRGNFHRYAPSTAGSQEIILTVELSNPKINKGNRLTDRCDMYNLCLLTELWFAVYA